MWEWSAKLLKKGKKSTDFKSLESTYKKFDHPQYKAVPNHHSTSIDEDNMLSLLINASKEYGLKNINFELKNYNPIFRLEKESEYAQTTKLRKIFLKYLGFTHSKECRDAGLSEEDISLLKNGILPENYTTHKKVPVDFGGDLDISNLSLIKNFPDHDNIHFLITMQVEKGFVKNTQKVFIPTFKGYIYDNR